MLATLRIGRVCLVTLLIAAFLPVWAAFPSASAQEAPESSTIALDFTVYDNGWVTIIGSSDLPIVIENSYYDDSDKTFVADTDKLSTFSEGEWKLSFGSNWTFDFVSIDIHLPEGSAYRGIEVSSDVDWSVEVAPEEDGLEIMLQTSSAQPNFTITYSIEKTSQDEGVITKTSKFVEENPLLVILIIAIILVSVRTLFYTLKPRGTKGRRLNKNALMIARGQLGDRQRLIADALLEEEGESTQALLMKRTSIPKATLSRLLVDLERSEIVERYRDGLSNVVRFHKKFWK